jgi:predicted Holliday junction resolvase-like endonuclease
MIILACLILAVVLTFTPVLLKMYMDTKKSEMRMERKFKELERKVDAANNRGDRSEPD